MASGFLIGAINIKNDFAPEESSDLLKGQWSMIL